MSENKILAQVAASLKSIHNGVNTLNENVGIRAEEFRYRMYVEYPLKIELMVMEAALKTVLNKAKFEEEYRKILEEIESQTRAKPG
ncbi:hypothetical protein [Cedecea colo]|uniref:Uncharacterized protein n=1 Tax=Cedecea colo TaxID=2552946 RepID=A0ABX0VG29_9ENTR|nr:hypothetical protein [Cedecea colo]NIY46152.1 hypothetical protein [Cedecea colo]